MSKVKKFFLILLIISIIFIANTSLARFADMEYPPNSSGYADFTDEEADKQAEEKAAREAAQQAAKEAEEQAAKEAAQAEVIEAQATEVQELPAQTEKVSE